MVYLPHDTEVPVPLALELVPGPEPGLAPGLAPELVPGPVPGLALGQMPVFVRLP